MSPAGLAPAPGIGRQVDVERCRRRIRPGTRPRIGTEREQRGPLGRPGSVRPGNDGTGNKLRQRPEEEAIARERPLDDDRPCSAGHTACYISPYGDVYPCVQFPLPTGNVRAQRFDEIWYRSPQMNEVREIRVRDLPTCSTCSYMPSCTRCPGLAYMEGSMRGPSSADCEKSQLRASAAAAIDVASRQGREGVVA